MIEDFDQLVVRCNAKRRKQMIRKSLWISGSILTFIAITAAAIQWLIPSHVPTKVKHLSHPIKTAIAQSNTTIAQTAVLPSPQSAVPISAETSLPIKDPTKVRAYAVQLTSSKSFDEVNASLRRIPEKYHPSLAIYYINGFYTLRYIDVYDRSWLPKMIEYFHSLGFYSTTAYKYNPERIPVKSATDAAKQAASATQTPVMSNDISVPVTTPEMIPAVTKNTSAGHLFSVQSSTVNTTKDLINSYNSNQKYETAMKIAQDFYAKNNFSDAAVWAKKANQLNREAEEAWLLYAKSYYAQGRKSDAIGILELYLNYKDSKAASELVRTWKSTPSN